MTDIDEMMEQWNWNLSSSEAASMADAKGFSREEVKQAMIRFGFPPISVEIVVSKMSELSSRNMLVDEILRDADL